MAEKLTLKQLEKHVDAYFYKKITDEWERITAYGFGDPEILIEKSPSKKTLITVLIKFQKSLNAYQYYDGDCHSIYLTEMMINWIKPTK